MGRRFLEMEEPLAASCPCCGETDANKHHSRLCHRVDAQGDQHQPLLYALSRT